MKNYNKSTPQGTRDLLFEECSARAEIRRRLSDLFACRGYSEIVTPTLEYYDVFARESSGLPQETMYKLTDNSGRLLVLRPDITLPIARVAATRLKDAPLPIRLCYTQKVFRVNPSLKGRSDEILQSGVELIGVSGVRADLEIIATAIEALSLCGAPEYQIEIGHTGFFAALTEQLAVDEDVLEDIRACIETKNYVALGLLLDEMEQSDAVRTLRLLPRLSGGEEVLSQAEELCGSIAGEPLAYIRRIYGDLCRLGQKDKITIDLGLVHRNHYYTGIVFRGYIDGSGVTVLTGGRYDRLLEEFGAPLPAVGFAVVNDALSDAMLTRGEAPAQKAPDVLVFGEDGFEMTALLHAKQLMDEGLVCEICLFDNEIQAAASMTARGIRRLDIIGEAVRTIEREEVAK